MIGMKKYQIQNSIGNGNFSTVFKAMQLPDRSPCAVKVMKTHHKIAYREAQLLNKIKHPNVIGIIDFEQTEDQSRIVLEYVGINTLELYQSHSYGLRQQQVKCILFQTALGLSCVHSYGVIHRDIKPENILIDKKLAIVKLIDFGLAIEQNQVSTDYIATRWYRAPENLLGTKEYTCAIDVFSLGCVIVELYLGSPLFPGANNIDQIYKIFNILGYPSYGQWPRGCERMAELGIRNLHLEKRADIDLKSIMNPCDPRLVDIVEKMLQLNPKNRISCIDILKHEYFRDIKSIVPPNVYRRFQVDILGLKPLSFKGFQPAKSSKNASNQNYRAVQQINFHNVPNKAKNNAYASKVVEKPQFLRQKKSISLDSCNSKAPSQKNIASHSVLPAIPPTETALINRKMSTPSLLSHKLNPSISQQTNSKISPFKQLKSFSQFAEPEQAKKSVTSSHQGVDPIVEQVQRQTNKQGIVNDLSQTTNSIVSRYQAPSILQQEQKMVKNISQIDYNRNVLRQQLVQNASLKQLGPMQQQNPAVKSPFRMLSPPNSLNFNPVTISFSSSQQQINQQKPSVANLNRPYLTNNRNQKILTISNNGPKAYRSFQGLPKHIQPRQNVSIKQKNVTGVHSPSHHNYSSNLNSTNARKPDHMTTRPQIVYRSPNQSSLSKHITPTQRLGGHMSPQNSFNNLARQQRVVPVNAPLQNYYSPTHRK